MKRYPVRPGDIPGHCTTDGGEPYSALASVYDHVMSHVDYIGWADYLIELFNFVRIPITTILETACGTASLALELAGRGKRIIACDKSYAMVHSGREKELRSRHHVPLFTADMRSLPVTGQFDAVICLYDSLNYLLKSDDLVAAFNEAYRVLKPGGIYVFDVCTVRNSELYFDDTSSSERCGATLISRQCYYDTDKRLQANHFVIEKPYAKLYRESHYQKIYYLREIEEMVDRTRFVEAGRFDDMSFAPGTELSDRVHFVLRKQR